MTNDEAFEIAATLVETATHWGLSPAQRRAVESFRRFTVATIRAQKSDSPERLTGCRNIQIDSGALA